MKGIELSVVIFVFVSIILIVFSPTGLLIIEASVTVPFTPEPPQVCTSGCGRGGTGPKILPPIEIELPKPAIEIPEKNIQVTVINDPGIIDMTNPRFTVDLEVKNVGTGTVEDMDLLFDYPIYWLSSRREYIGTLRPGQSKIITLSYYSDICHSNINKEKIDRLFSSDFVSNYFVVSDGELLAETSLHLEQKKEDFMILSAPREHNSKELTVCFIENANKKSRPSGEIEIEFGIYLDNNAYLADFLGEFPVKEGELFITTKTYTLQDLPENTEYEMRGAVFKDGKLYQQSYKTHYDSTILDLTDINPDETISKKQIIARMVVNTII